MIALLRSTDGNPDSRFEKYINFLDVSNVKYLSICWDRNSDKFDDEKHVYYHVAAKFGEGFSNVKKIIGFNFFILKQLFKHRSNYSIIHAADFDTVLPAILMRLFYNKHVIYDIYDWYIDSRCINNYLIKYLVLFLEYFNIKLSDNVIICEKEREKQIMFKPKNLWVLPNIPNYDKCLPRGFTNKQLVISYVGVLGYERGIEKLVKYAKENPFICLKIAGFGPLENLFSDISNYPNITYYGSVKYDEALKIMNSSDIIYAVYETTNRNHILAAPNKYYEGLHLGKPIITTKGTIVGEKTAKYNTGFVIGESYEDLCKLIDDIQTETISEYSMNAINLWENKYSNYVSNFLINKYLPYIKSHSRNFNKHRK